MQFLTNLLALLTLLALLPFLTSTLALALPSPSPTPHHQTKNFTLKSHVLSPANPSLENLYLEPYHIYPSFNYATLYPKTAQTPGIVGFINGTKTEIEDEEADLLFYGGAGFGYGFVIGTYTQRDMVIVFVGKRGG